MLENGEIMEDMGEKFNEVREKALGNLYFLIT